MSSSQDQPQGGSAGTFPGVPNETPSSYINPLPAPTIEEFNGTLVGATVDTITFVNAHVGVRITSISGSAVIQYTVDGSTPAAGTSPELAAVAGSSVIVPFDDTELAVVKLLSAGTPTVAVEGLDELEMHLAEEDPGTTDV
jgi:hypothetical protein